MQWIFCISAEKKINKAVFCLDKVHSQKGEILIFARSKVKEAVREEMFMKVVYLRKGKP